MNDYHQNKSDNASHIITLAEKVFGDKEKAKEWLHSQIPALGGKVPVNILDTHAGREIVRQALRKIELGDYV